MEKHFELAPTVKAINDYYFIAPVSCVLYVMIIFMGQRYMKNKRPYDLKKPLQLWNLFLCIFSFMGVVRILPPFVAHVYSVGFRSSLCSPTPPHISNGVVGFWSTLFVFSKYVEFLDTAFIILRKRNLAFIHWYHHASVLFCSWFSFLAQQPAALYFCTMNYTVHAVMYYYYFLSVTLSTPPTWGIYITLLQILQMAGGCFLTLSGLFYAHPTLLGSLFPFMSRLSPSSSNCAISLPSLYACTIMYISYLYLFSVFFFNRYLKKVVSPKKHV